MQWTNVVYNKHVQMSAVSKQIPSVLPVSTTSIDKGGHTTYPKRLFLDQHMEAAVVSG